MPILFRAASRFDRLAICSMVRASVEPSSADCNSEADCASKTESSAPSVTTRLALLPVGMSSTPGVKRSVSTMVVRVSLGAAGAGAPLTGAEPLKVNFVRPTWNVPPSWMRASVIFSPSTVVPLVLPRSFTRTTVPSRLIRA
ncbi:MAG: hypothetical protein ACYTDX_04700 [Planctomycetota bacterium]